MSPNFRVAVPAAAALLLAGAVGAPVFAKETVYTVVLSGKAETPPTTSTGKGSGKVVYDDKTGELRWNISFSGLTGPATAAHFHGPAAPGAAAGVEVAVKAAAPLESPLVGSATLTPDQAKDLAAGMLYFNIHTDANKGGEVRGQVVRVGGKPPKAAKAATDMPAHDMSKM